MIEAGFSPKTANKRSKEVLQSAIKHQAREILEMNGASPTTSKKLMTEIMGISRESLFSRLKYLAFDQDKDMGTSLKILTSLAKEHGYSLVAEESNVTVPILNVTVEKNTENMAKNIEPNAEHLIES